MTSGLIHTRIKQISKISSRIPWLFRVNFKDIFLLQHILTFPSLGSPLLLKTCTRLCRKGGKIVYNKFPVHSSLFKEPPNFSFCQLW